jgi:hypothetical protein
MKKTHQIKQAYLARKKALKKSLVIAKKQKNISRIQYLKEQLSHAKDNYREELKAWKIKNKENKMETKKIKRLNDAKILTQKNTNDVKQLKEESLHAKLNYRKVRKPQKTEKFKKIKSPNKITLLKRKYLAQKEALKTNLDLATQQKNKTRIKELSNELFYAKLNFLTELKTLNGMDSKKIEQAFKIATLKQKYVTQIKTLRANLIAAEEKKNTAQVEQLAKQLFCAKIDYRKSLNTLKEKDSKRIEYAFQVATLKLNYAAQRKALNASLDVAKEQKNQSNIEKIRGQLSNTEITFYKELKLLKEKYLKKAKPQSKTFLLKQKYLTVKKQLKNDLLIAIKADDESKIKLIKDQLRKAKRQYYQARKECSRRKILKTKLNKQIAINNFNIIALTASITSLFILIIFALIGATNVVPTFQIIVSDGTLTAFGIVFILLLILIIVLLVSTLAFYISHFGKGNKNNKKVS